MDSSLERQDLSTVSTEIITILSKNRRDITKVSKPEILFISSGLNISEEIDLVNTKDVYCNTNRLRSEIKCACNGTLLINAFKDHISSLERQLKEKQTIIELLLTNFQHRLYSNTVAISNHEVAEKIAENIDASKGDYSKCSSINNINPNNDNTMLSKKVNNVPLNKSKENLSNSFNLNSSKSFEKQITVDKKASHDDKNAQESTEPGIKDTDQIYNTNDLVNSTTSQSLVSSALKEKNHAEEKKQKENVFIIGDSMVKNVNAFKLAGMFDHRRIVKKRDFSSAKISCMKDYIKSTLRQLDPEHVILHVCTNNLILPLPPKEIADGIIDLAKSMKTDNRNITISTIISRGDKLNNKANEVNNFLIQLCRDCNIPFIDHSKNINPHKHLNSTGNRIFVDNIKRFLIKYY